MIREIVVSIVDAEKSAEKIIASAKAHGDKSLHDAEIIAEEICQQSKIDIKNKTKEILLKGNEAGEKLAQKDFDAGKKAAEEEIKKYRCNLQKATDYIVESVLNKWQ